MTMEVDFTEWKKKRWADTQEERRASRLNTHKVDWGL